MHQRGKVQVAKLLQGVSQQCTIRGVAQLKPALHVRDGDADARVLKCFSEARLALARRIHGLLQLVVSGNTGNAPVTLPSPSPRSTAATRVPNAPTSVPVYSISRPGST